MQPLKRSVIVGGQKTSVSVEKTFWACLREIAIENGETVSGLINQINSKRKDNNLSSALRVYVIDHYKHRSRTTRRRQA